MINEGGKGYLRHRNKVAVFEHLSGDVVISHSTLSLGGSVEDACNGIVQHWTSHSGDMLSAKQKASAPSSPTPIATPPPQLPSASQASLIIDSMPVGADIEIDGVFVGNTPSTISVDPGTHDINVKKKGFTVWTRKLKATSGSVHVNAELEPQATTTPASVNTPQ